jgi:hypothetical protein
VCLFCPGEILGIKIGGVILIEESWHHGINCISNWSSVIGSMVAFVMDLHTCLLVLIDLAAGLEWLARYLAFLDCRDGDTFGVERCIIFLLSYCWT